MAAMTIEVRDGFPHLGTVTSIIRSATCRLLPQPLHLNPHRFELSVSRGATIPTGKPSLESLIQNGMT